MSFNCLLQSQNIGLFIILTNKNLICVCQKRLSWGYGDYGDKKNYQSL
jgi:hypothetical protein